MTSVSECAWRNHAKMKSEGELGRLEPDEKSDALVAPRCAEMDEQLGTERKDTHWRHKRRREDSNNLQR